MRSCGLRNGMAGLFVGVSLLAGTVESVRAQSFDLGLGAAFYVDVPEPFSDPYCNDAPAGLAGTAAWSALDWLALEGAASVNAAVGGTTCAIADFAPIPFDVAVVQSTWPDELYGSSFFSTHLSAVVEPFRAWPVSPRARVGIGRIWDKDLMHRVLGLGVRYAFGRHALVMDLDAWGFRVEEEVTTVIYRANAPTEILSSETIEHDFRPVVVRIGWEVSVGR